MTAILKAAGLLGTGLGLTICRHIAAAHQAEMKVDARPGGTVFTFALPFAAD